MREICVFEKECVFNSDHMYGNLLALKNVPDFVFQRLMLTCLFSVSCIL